MLKNKSKDQKILKEFPKTFWIANTMELFERWAWYGMFAILALYITQSTDQGALGFTQSQKGLIMGSVTGILYLLPVITGSISDRIGYKKTLIIAFFILISGYMLMGYVKSFWLFYFSFLWVALGAALFKPIVSATVAKTTSKDTSSIGFGIFYMIVNIGGFLGPLFSSKLRNIYGWNIVFIMATSVIFINLILVTFFYKEPDIEKNENSFGKTIAQSILNIWTAIKDLKLFIFLIIMIGFWTMFNQLFYTLPNFIDQWVNTNIIYNFLKNISPKLALAIGTKDGRIAPEIIINLDAGSIILFQIFISALVMRFRLINSIIIGIIVNAIGIGITFGTGNGFYVIIGIFIFAIGEMASSPKFTEYIGKIAPKGKEALYMGTSFLPVAAGNLIAGYLSGSFYEKWSDKINLLKTEVAVRGLKIPDISTQFSQNDYFNKAAELMGMNHKQLTNYLWNTYHPSKIWMVFTTIGITTIIGLFLYDKFILNHKNK